MRGDKLQDDKIVELYWKREETAIAATEKKYGAYLMKIAYNILADREDSRECVNDTYMKVWNCIPPHRPEALSAFLAKIARQTAIDIFRRKTSQKRRASEYAVSLSELEDCIGAANTVETEVDARSLADAINNFLGELSVVERDVFIGRYYFADSVGYITAYCNITVPKTKSMLYRLRSRLKIYLKQEGYFDEQ